VAVAVNLLFQESQTRCAAVYLHCVGQLLMSASVYLHCVGQLLISAAVYSCCRTTSDVCSCVFTLSDF
jgi:hypothetical protein